MLERAEGNVSQVARDLGTTRAQVYRWMNSTGVEYGVAVPRTPGWKPCSRMRGVFVRLDQPVDFESGRRPAGGPGLRAVRAA